MGWVLKGSRQKLVVCRYEEEPARGVSSNSHNLVVKETEGKPDRKPYSLPHGLRNPYRNLKSENSQDYAQEPLTKLYVHEFGFFTC